MSLGTEWTHLTPPCIVSSIHVRGVPLKFLSKNPVSKERDVTGDFILKCFLAKFELKNEQANEP